MRRQLPPWAIGFLGAPAGFVSGMGGVALPILLAAQGVSVGRIGVVVSVSTSPMFWYFLVAPVLDAHFSRRRYAVALGALSTLLMGAALLLLHHTALLTATMLLASLTVYLYNASVNGWVIQVVAEEHYSTISGFGQVANLGAGGAFGALVVWLVRTLPPLEAALALMAVYCAPMGLMFFLRVSTTLPRAFAEAFGTLFRDLWAVLRQREYRYVLAAFLLPSCSFALLFSSIGAQFHTAEREVALLTGIGSGVACSVGCLVGIPIARRWKKRTVYLLTGVFAAACTGAMMVLPHSPAVFVAGCMVYSLLQGVNYTVFAALTMELVGPRNPLAATLLSLLSSASSLPISFMIAMDGLAFSRLGVNGMLGSDTVFALVTAVPLLVFFAYQARRVGGALRGPQIEPLAAEEITLVATEPI
jgi:PAT family beta-lactamase induction signal transducer AmpG